MLGIHVAPTAGGQIATFLAFHVDGTPQVYALIEQPTFRVRAGQNARVWFFSGHVGFERTAVTN